MRCHESKEKTLGRHSNGRLQNHFSFRPLACRLIAALSITGTMDFPDRESGPMTSRAMPVFLVLPLCFCESARSQQEPAGEGRPITPTGSFVLDRATHLPAVGAMPMTMLRSPDALGHDGKGRYLLVVNSGYGVQFSEDTNKAQQSIAVIDLNASPAPMIIQNVYFPTPQSVNVGLAFSPAARSDGSFEIYVSGGFENKVWIFRFDPKAAEPLQPGSPGPATKVSAPFLVLTKPGEASPKDYNKGKAALYPAGLAVTSDGTMLVTANNLGDSVTIVHGLKGARRMERVDLHHPGKPNENIYPYGVVALGRGKNARAYVSCWNDSSVAVISLPKMTLKRGMNSKKSFAMKRAFCRPSPVMLFIRSSLMIASSASSSQ